MKNKSSFLLVPNHSAALLENEIYMESAEIDLIRKVRQEQQVIGIAAFTMEYPNTSLSGKLSSKDATLHSLGEPQSELGILGKPLAYVKASIALPQLILKHQFVYIFCPGYCSLIAGIWSKLLRKPYGLYVRGTWQQDKRIFELLWNKVFKSASFMIVTGESFRKSLTVHCTNVENEVPLTALRPDQIDLTLIPERSSLDLLYVGRLSESKGVKDAIHSIALLKNIDIVVTLRIAGGGTKGETESLINLIDHLDLHDNVNLLGHLSPSQLQDEYKRAGIFIFPSYYAEGFPRVLYEAMMFGCAIVTCPMPGTKDFLIESRNCLFSQPRNPNELSDKIKHLVESPTLAREIGLSAYEDVSALYRTFTDASHADQVMKNIHQLSSI